MEPFHFRRGFVQPLKLSAGFTLIEMMVVLAIIVVITTIALTSQSSFNKTLILANTAYDIALTLRSAETFGISSRGLVSTANAGYGLHFETATPGSFILFADTNGGASCANQPPDCKSGNHFYTAADYVPTNGTYTLGNGIVVSDFCAYPVVGVWSCAHTNGSGLNSLDIVFTRPNPDAFISTNSNYSGPPFAITKACLVISSPQGGSPRYVTVAASGEITANASSCP